MGNLSQRTNDWFFEQIDFLTKMNVLTKRNIHYHWITRTLITSKTSKFTQLSVQPRACARPRGLPRRSFGLCGWTWTPLKEFDKPSICTHIHTHTRLLSNQLTSLTRVGPMTHSGYWSESQLNWNATEHEWGTNSHRPALQTADVWAVQSNREGTPPCFRCFYSQWFSSRNPC